MSAVHETLTERPHPGDVGAPVARIRRRRGAGMGVARPGRDHRRRLRLPRRRDRREPVRRRALHARDRHAERPARDLARRLHNLCHAAAALLPRGARDPAPRRRHDPAAAPVAHPRHGGHPARLHVRAARGRPRGRACGGRAARPGSVRHLLLDRGARVRAPGLPHPRRHPRAPTRDGRRPQGVLGGVGRRLVGGDVDALHEPVRAARPARLGAVGPARVPPAGGAVGPRGDRALAALGAGLPEPERQPRRRRLRLLGGEGRAQRARLPGARPARQPVRRTARRAGLARAARRRRRGGARRRRARGPPPGAARRGSRALGGRPRGRARGRHAARDPALRPGRAVALPRTEPPGLAARDGRARRPRRLLARAPRAARRRWSRSRS